VRSILLIDGLDPSGGVGLLADARILDRNGFRAVGVATALTERTTGEYRAANPVGPEILAGQLTALLSDVEVAAVKIGMVPTEPVAQAIDRALALTAAPVVWHPEFGASAGGVARFEGDPQVVVEALGRHLALAILAPVEAAILTGSPAGDRPTLLAAASELAGRCGAILITGDGACEGPGGVLVVDGAFIEVAGGGAPVVEGEPRGTRPALATAIACGLAAGLAVADAIRAGLRFVGQVGGPVRAGRGAPSIL